VLELTRSRVLRWLEAVAGVAGIPDEGDEIEQKSWLLNNFAADSVLPFSEIPSTDIVTKALYTLVHSVCHTLLSSASSLAGLDKNSMSELLFPTIPAFVIYSNSSSDSQLGGMFTLFESQFTTWLELAVERARKCLYNPMCIEGKGACHACLYLAEISCEHSNRDLNRGSLVGRTDGPFSTGYWSPAL